jgi:hypothetical protein
LAINILSLTGHGNWGIFIQFKTPFSGNPVGMIYL